MDITRRFVEEAVKNAGLVNLDLDEAERRDAFREVAAHMRVLASMDALSRRAENVMRVMMAHGPLWRDRRAFLAAAAEALAPRGGERDGDEVAMFLQLAEGRRDAVVSSDVDGLKGLFAIEEAGAPRVVRLAGDAILPYEHGVPGLVRIMDDGAYSIEDRT